MSLFPRSALAFSAAALAVTVHADPNMPNTDPRTIAGTYAVTTAQNCVFAAEPGPGQSPFTIVTTPNGQPQVVANVPASPPGVPPVLKLISTVAHLTLVINPRAGTLSSGNVLVTRLDENRGAGQTMVLQRTMRTLQGTFTVDRATDTLLLGAETEQGTLPDGASTFVLTHAPGRRMATNDFRQSIYGAGSDMPELIEQVTTAPTETTYSSIACDRTVSGHRISLRY